MHRVVAGASFAIALLSLAASAAVAGQNERPRILAARVDGPITPVVSDYVTDSLEKAEREEYDAFLLRFDTPGGLDSSMREIVQAFLGARIPVIVYVTPAGARAASAGSFITMSAHVAAMAPGTNIGASTPIDLQGGDVGNKIINDAEAYAKAIAELRGRDVGFAVDTVRRGRSEPATRAEEIGAIDFVVKTESELFARADGKKVTVASGKEVTVRSKFAEVNEDDMSVFQRLLQLLADPNVAFLFMSIGSLAIIYEIATPGIGAGGIVGGIMVLLALFALSTLPVNTVGLLLVLLGIALFIGEVFAPGLGVFAFGGAVSLALGGIFLFRDASGLEVPLTTVLPVSAAAAVAAAVAARFALRSRNAPSRETGPESFVGRQVIVKRSDGSRGQTFVSGAWWKIRNDAGELQQESTVEVVAVEGLELVVRPLETSATEGNATE